MAGERRYVLDSSALIALLAREPGAEVVAAALPNAVISAVNLAESLAKLARRGGNAEAAAKLLQALDLDIEPWTAALVWQGRDLCSLAWTQGISFADRACLTLARASRRTALTADRRWATLGLAIPIELIRGRR